MDNIIINDTNTPNTIRYRVVLNPAASKSAEHDVYTATTEIKECYNLTRIAMRMVERGCTANKSTIRLVLTEFAELVSDLVAEGYAVNIPGLVRFAPSVRGTFASVDAPWNAKENQIVVNATVGSRMRLAAAQTSPQRITTVALPTLEQLVDMATHRPDVISSEGSFLVTGTKLTWDTTAEDEGFFLNVGGEESKCTPLEGEQDAECAVLKTTQLFEQSGLPVELFFRTRIDGALHQVKYDGAITSQTND